MPEIECSIHPPQTQMRGSLLPGENMLLCCRTQESKIALPPERNMCAELDALKRDAGKVLRELKNIRRSRDVSFYEDAELNRRKRESLNAVLKHLLVGHDGKPCPAGDRPIVRPVPYRRKS